MMLIVRCTCHTTCFKKKQLKSSAESHVIRYSDPALLHATRASCIRSRPGRNILESPFLFANGLLTPRSLLLVSRRAKDHGSLVRMNGQKMVHRNKMLEYFLHLRLGQPLGDECFFEKQRRRMDALYLFNFLSKLQGSRFRSFLGLNRVPARRDWNLYSQEASYTGTSSSILAFIDPGKVGGSESPF